MKTRNARKAAEQEAVDRVSRELGRPALVLIARAIESGSLSACVFSHDDAEVTAYHDAECPKLEGAANDCGCEPVVEIVWQGVRGRVEEDGTATRLAYAGEPARKDRHGKS